MYYGFGKESKLGRSQKIWGGQEIEFGRGFWVLELNN